MAARSTLFDLMGAVKQEVNKSQRSKALLTFPNVSLEHMMVQVLKLSEQEQQDLKTMLGFIVHKHNSIATWMPTVKISKKGALTIKHIQPNRQKLIDSNILASIPDTTLQEKLMDVLFTWEERSQKAWEHRITRQHSLSKEQKHFYTCERIMCLLAHKYSQNGFQNIPLEVVVEICKYLPVTLHGGLAFSTQEHWEFEMEGAWLILDPGDGKFALYWRKSITTNTNTRKAQVTQGKYEIQGNGKLVLKCETLDVMEDSVMSYDTHDDMVMEMVMDAQNGGIAVKYFDYMLREIHHSEANKMQQFVATTKQYLDTAEIRSTCPQRVEVDVKAMLRGTAPSQS